MGEKKVWERLENDNKKNTKFRATFLVFGSLKCLRYFILFPNAIFSFRSLIQQFLDNIGSLLKFIKCIFDFNNIILKASAVIHRFILLFFLPSYPHI